jgi:hypothetical protein
MKRALIISGVLAAAMAAVGCGGGSASSSTGTSGSSQSSSVFVTGEDAAASSVVSLNATINSITLSDGTHTVTALSTPVTVDFARLVGLRTLLAFNTITPGTYTSATITFASSNPSPSINYVDVSTNPPTLSAATGSLTSTSVTVQFPSGKPLTVAANGLAGVHMDFDIRHSVATDTNGNLVVSNGTIAITPTMSIMAVSATDANGQITEFGGNVVSTAASSNSFIVQGPYGFQETIKVDSNTQYNSSNSLSSLAANQIVSVQGTVQADGSILASNVEVVTTDQAFISGRILAVGPGPSVTMFVGEELGTSATIPVDSVYTVNLSAVTEYDICFIDNWFTGQLFNASSLVAGQRIFVGGTYASNTFTPQMVSLRRQGVEGSLVANSVVATNGNIGTFQLQNDALMSYAAGGPFVVDTVTNTAFSDSNGLTGLQAAGTANVEARGLVFYDPNTHKPVVFAHLVNVMQ